MSDRTLQSLVESELEWDPRINAAEIGVAVDKGVVTLTGAVSTYYEKLNVERVALRVKGVRGLAADVVVRPFGDIGNSDDEVAKRVLSSLEWDVTIPNKAVQVRVEKGAVTLTGEVDWDFQRDAAERDAEKLHGVRSVTNSMTLKSRVIPANVHHRIVDALKRQGHIHAKDIRVSVDGGTVSLDGEVDAWHDREVIEDAAWAAPGVFAVVDRVTVAA